MCGNTQVITKTDTEMEISKEDMLAVALLTYHGHFMISYSKYIAYLPFDLEHQLGHTYTVRNLIERPNGTQILTNK